MTINVQQRRRVPNNFGRRTGCSVAVRALLLLGGCFLLAGCGGGGGSGGHEVVAPAVAVIAARPLLFAYFGVMGSQIKETVAHVNCLFTMMWNFENWTPQGRQWIADQAIAQLEEARDAGIKRFIVDVGPWIFDPRFEYQGTAALAPFVDQLKARGLWGYVDALYPIDEPDLVGIDDAQMTRINTDLHAFGKPVTTIYTDRRKWPGLATCDRPAFDKYDVDVHGDGVLADLKGRLRPDQRILLVCGGADPWRDNVRPVLAYANGDPQVDGIVAFIYGDIGASKGIRNNGMIDEYKEVGTTIKNASVV